MWGKIKPYTKGWRTVALNVFAMVLPIASLTEWNSVLPREWLPYYVLGLGVANILMRSLTTTPMGKHQ